MNELNIDWEQVVNHGKYDHVPETIPDDLSPPQYLDLAKNYAKKHLPDHASECLLRAVVGDPDLEKKANLIRRTELPVLAHPADAIKLNLSARAKGPQGKSLAEKCIKLYPDYEYGLLTLAEFEDTRQNWKESLCLHQRVLEINPYNRKAINYLFNEHSRKYRLKKARALIDKILELNPQDFDAEEKVFQLKRDAKAPLVQKMMAVPALGKVVQFFGIFYIWLFYLVMALLRRNRITSGFIDKEGNTYLHNMNVVVQSDFSQGVYCVRNHGSAFYVNKAGERLCEQTFEWGENFSDGRASVRAEGKWGFIDLEGKFAIEPKFSDVGFFVDGLAPAQLNDLWGFIDKSGNWMIEPRFENALSYSDGRAAVSLDGKIGFIDTRGELVIPPRYEEADTFSEGLARVIIYDKDNDDRHIVRYIDIKGDTMFDLEQALLNAGVKCRYWSYGKAQHAIKRQDWEYIYAGKGESRHTFPSVIHGQLDHQYKRQSLRNGRIHFTMDGKTGFLNRDGELVIPFEFYSALPFSDGLAKVSLQKPPIHYNDPEWQNVRYGYIDVNGDFSIPPHFRSACSFSDGLAKVEIKNKYCFINTNGDVVLTPKSQEQFGEFKEGMAPFKCFDAWL